MAVPLLLGALAAVVLVASGLGQQPWQPGYDLAVYRDGARDLLAGRDVYLRETWRGHWFVYPPLAAVLFLPLLLLPAAVDLLLWDALLLALTAWAAVRVLRAAGAPALLVGCGAGAVLLSDPFREALVLGQVSPLVVTALVVGCLHGGRGGAVLAALAGAVKVTPALVVAAVLNGPARRRFALPVVAVGAGATLLGALAAPASARSYFTDLLWNSARVAAPGTTSNNSLAGAFAHAGLADAAAGALGLVCALPLLALVALAARRCDWAQRAHRLRFGLLVSLVTCLVSPVTWSHHALAAPLAAGVLLAGRRRWRVVPAALAGVPWLLPVLQAADALGGAGGALLAQARPLSLLVLTALLAAPLLRGAPRSSR
ncbi:glycosyltransferase family 87 protein [Kineococcus sp. SYSU DK006]|uniref:glycosyltransferase family 87 protein n=1 Tax=Kineococcus sp. SYSU DK006 TaxID=3383127 RepID=UPI003D7DB550